MVGGAVIIVPPFNVTRLEGNEVQMPCEARGLPGNFTVTWFRESHEVRSIPWLKKRTNLLTNGMLVISPVHSDDRGLYTCEVTNGIGDPQRASAYFEVECNILFLFLFLLLFITSFVWFVLFYFIYFYYFVFFYYLIFFLIIWFYFSFYFWFHYKFYFDFFLIILFITRHFVPGVAQGQRHCAITFY